MRQDIILISPWTEHLANVCEILKCFGLTVFQFDGIESVNAELVTNSPAFILLDGDLECLKSFVSKILRCYLNPPPYIIVASLFEHRNDYINMLNIGADACVSNPICVEEILAVVRAVHRRERRLAQLQDGKPLPCIEYKQLAIDPLCRIVTMGGEQVELTAKEFRSTFS